MRNRAIILISVVIFLIMTGSGVWFFWGQNYLEKQSEIRGIYSRFSRLDIPGYVRRDDVRTSKQLYEYILQTRYKPSAIGVQDEDVILAVSDVVVTVVKYKRQEDVENEIREAGLIYSWERRKELIGGREAYFGFLLDLNRGTYTEAYISWVEETTYFEVVARPDITYFKDFSQKDILYEAAREVAESILAQRGTTRNHAEQYSEQRGN